MFLLYGIKFYLYTAGRPAIYVTGVHIIGDRSLILYAITNFSWI